MERNVLQGASVSRPPAGWLLAQASVQVCGALLMVAASIVCWSGRGTTRRAMKLGSSIGVSIKYGCHLQSFMSQVWLLVV